MEYCQIKSTKNLDIHDDIFKNYPDPTYLVKIRKLNRPLILFKDVLTDRILGLCVLNKYGRHLKICLLIVHPSFKNKNLGNRIIKSVMNMFFDDFSDIDVLYTVCPRNFNTDSYQNLLIKNGFILSTIKANGELVYTYAKSI